MSARVQDLPAPSPLPGCRGPHCPLPCMLPLPTGNRALFSRRFHCTDTVRPKPDGACGLSRRVPADSGEAPGRDLQRFLRRETAGRNDRRHGFTGVRRVPRTRGRFHWLHVACTCLLMHFMIGRGRGDIMLEALGIVVHDCRKSCFVMPHVAGHGMWRAHVMRKQANLFQFGIANH